MSIPLRWRPPLALILLVVVPRGPSCRRACDCATLTCETDQFAVDTLVLLLLLVVLLLLLLLCCCCRRRRRLRRRLSQLPYSLSCLARASSTQCQSPSRGCRMGSPSARLCSTNRRQQSRNLASIDTTTTSQQQQCRNNNKDNNKQMRRPLSDVHGTLSPLDYISSTYAFGRAVLPLRCTACAMCTLL